MKEKEELVKLSFYISKEAYPSVEKYLRANGYEPIEDVDVSVQVETELENLKEFVLAVTSNRNVMVYEKGIFNGSHDGGIIFRQRFFGELTNSNPYSKDELEINIGDVISYSSYYGTRKVKVVQLID